MGTRYTERCNGFFYYFTVTFVTNLGFYAIIVAESTGICKNARHVSFVQPVAGRERRCMSKSKVDSHKFCGKRYAIRSLSGVQAPNIGLCNFEKKILHIPVDGDTFAELDTIVHEALHACCPYLGEFEVNESARDIARLLWRLQWRKEV